MNIEFLGHAAVGLKSETGESLIIDPYRSGGFGGKMNYTPIGGEWDWVIVTHDHDDHNAKDTLLGTLNDNEKELEARFQLRRIQLAHDEYEGGRFGGYVDAICFQFDSLTVCHLSDVGCAPTKSAIEAIGPVDLCFIPTGGLYTIGPLQAKAWWRALSPTVAIPIHYKTPSVDLELDEVESFLNYFQPEMIQKSSRLTIQDRSALSKCANIIVLEALNAK